MPERSLNDFRDLDARGRSKAVIWHAAFAPVWTRVIFPRRFEGTWSPSDLQVLIYVKQAPDCTTEDIADGLALDRTTVTQSCKKLGEAKMLASEHDPTGRSNRTRRWRITRKGTNLYRRWGESAVARWEEYLDGVLASSAYRE